MFPRQLASTLVQMHNFFPVVTVTGPRQSGKTTLVKSCFPGYRYINLEDISYRQLAKEDPNSLVRSSQDGVIIDEIQHVPELLSAIQVAVDEDKKRFKFILTGSNQFEYMKNISQSLAGRTGILKLLPATVDELQYKLDISSSKMIYNGFYPALYQSDFSPSMYYQSYIATYLERDIRQLINVRDITTFHKFLSLCAGRTGQILNMNSLALDAGVSHTTVQNWISILEASFIIFRLQPYFKNFNKRIIKSPKLYFYDTGIVCQLLGIVSEQQLDLHPLRGEIFETMVVSDFMKQYYNRGLQPNLYYWRNQQGYELDLLVETALNIIPLEIKSASSFRSDFMKNFTYFNRIQEKDSEGFLILNHEIDERVNTVNVTSFRHVQNIVDRILL
jgi:uncharacterized protein